MLKVRIFLCRDISQVLLRPHPCNLNVLPSNSHGNSIVSVISLYRKITRFVIQCLEYELEHDTAMNI